MADDTIPDEIPILKVWGDVSKKRLGEMVATMLRGNSVIIVDAREVRAIAGKKIERSGP